MAKDPFGIGIATPSSDVKDLEAWIDCMLKRVATVESENIALKVRLDTMLAVCGAKPQPSVSPSLAPGGGTMDDILRQLKDLEDSIDLEVIMINQVPSAIVPSSFWPTFPAKRWICLMMRCCFSTRVWMNWWR